MPVRAEDNDVTFRVTVEMDSIPFVNQKEFAGSIHGGNMHSCHADEVIPHPQKLAPVSCRMCQG